MIIFNNLHIIYIYYLNEIFKNKHYSVFTQCDCCQSTGEDLISPTLPDLSVVYKLHLESRKLINMYDWLQV